MNVIPAAMHIKEASELLKYELPDVSTILLQLVQQMLVQFKIDNEDLLSAQTIVSEISSDSSQNV